MKSLFFTGTDTGVGKTLVAGSVAANLSISGIKTGVMKPCESGCPSENGTLIAHDALFLKKMSGCPESIERICPYRLRSPLAPGVAAEIEGVHIDVTKIKSVFNKFLHKYDIVICEGAGGIMVPLTIKLLYCDFVKKLDIPLVVVARLSLGTINHTLLTINLAKHMDISVKGIILNRTSSISGTEEKTNPDIIKSFSRVPVIGIMPFIKETNRDDPEFLSRIAAENIDINFLMK